MAFRKPRQVQPVPPPPLAVMWAGKEFVYDLFPGVRRGARPSLRSLQLFPVPVVERLDPADHADAAPEDLVRARVPADVVRLARAPRDQRQAILARAERVRDSGAGRARDDVAATDLLCLRLVTELAGIVIIEGPAACRR